MVSTRIRGPTSSRGNNYAASVGENGIFKLFLERRRRWREAQREGERTKEMVHHKIRSDGRV